MREDMAKVIAERPRLGGNGYRKGRKKLLQQTSVEDLSSHESIRAEWFGDRKRSDLHLKPLRRYLSSQIGRPWNVVFSDICHRINADSGAERRVFFRLQFEVEQNVHFIGDQPYRIGGHYRLSPGNLYVHPDTGVLTQVALKARPRWKNRPIFPAVVKDDVHRYVRLNGLWFDVTFAPLPSGEEIAYDIVTQKIPTLRDAISTWGAAVYAVEKRQASGKEIKRVILPALAAESAQ